MLGPDNLTRSGEWSETGKGKNGEDVSIKGYWSEIDTREGDGWKNLCVDREHNPESKEPLTRLGAQQVKLYKKRRRFEADMCEHMG